MLVWLLIMLLYADHPLHNFLQSAIAQTPKPDQSRRNRPMDNAGNDRLTHLIELEEKEPTNPGNVIERHEGLISIFRFDPGSRRVVPKDTAMEIQDLIDRDDLSQAADLVHDIILKLKTYRMKRPGFGNALTPFEPVFHIDVNQLVNKTTFDNVLKLHHSAVDAKKRRLYVSGTKTFYLGVIDLDKDELVETFNMGITGGFLLSDPKSDHVYLFDIPRKKYYRINVEQREVTEVNGLPDHLSMPEKNAPITFDGYSYQDTGYPFRAGYLQKENAAYGVIEVRNTSGRLVDQILHGPDALFFGIDMEKGKLYATNTGDASISVFDLTDRRKKIKDIDVGTSVDEIIVNKETGGIYIRNRLGGSTVYYYDSKSGHLRTIPNENTAGVNGIGMWPTQIIYDRDRLYVLSHYGGRIDIIDTASHQLTGRIDLDLSLKPRMDCISTMAMDRRDRMLYAAFPELGEIAVVDAATLKQIKTLKVKSFNRGGAARIVLEVDEKLKKLFVYIPDEKRLYAYNCNTFLQEAAVPLDVGRIEHVLKSNPERHILYAGNKVLCAETLEVLSQFEKGDVVVAYRNEIGKVYLKDFKRIGRGKSQEKIYEYTDRKLEREWTLPPIHSIPSPVAFDFDRNKFYVGYYETAVIEAFNLTDD